MTATGSGPVRIGLIQMSSGSDPARNMAFVAQGVREAAARGCAYVQTPENTTIMGLEPAALLAAARPEAQTPAVAQLADLARKHGLWLHAGSLPVVAEDMPGKLANRSLLFAPDGRIAARYDKIHLFDVDLMGQQGAETYRESATIRGGSAAVTAALPFGILGLAICYDLRFAALFRTLAQAGAMLLTVPAAFTRITGQAHWHVLLRARAIETGTYVAAAAQCGTHPNGRLTFGHSLIVDPWGTVIAQAEDEPGVITAMIDPAAVTAARQRIPALKHDRTFAGPAA